jgi:hypothetical protein
MNKLEHKPGCMVTHIALAAVVVVVQIDLLVQIDLENRM